MAAVRESDARETFGAEAIADEAHVVCTGINGN